MANLSYILFFVVITFVSAFPDRVILPANNGSPTVVVVKQPKPVVVQPARQVAPQRPIVVQQPGRPIVQQGPIKPNARPVVVVPQQGPKVVVVQKQPTVVVQKQPQVVVVPSRKF
ncbi:uncharacterized protein [Chironomus tepperi]|uniref:uncharacterized protein n=1 Tax=Chironomus tepperi TaxID=113505 RepID=UPI00391F80DA